MQHQDLDCDGRPYQRMPRHAPPPPVTPVDPYAPTEPVLSDTLERAEVPLPPAAGAAALSEIIEGAATAPWKDAAAETLHRAAALEARRDALLRGLEARPRDPHTDRIRRRLALLRAAVARDADVFLRKKLEMIGANDRELARIGSRERHAQHDLRLVRMALSRLGVDLDASSSSSEDDEPQVTTRKREPSPEGFPKRFLADAYLAADRAAKKLKGSGDEFFEGVAAIQALLDQSDEYEPNGDLLDFARDTLFDFSRVKDPPRRPSWEQPVPDQRVVVESPPSNLASAAEVSELLRAL